MPIQNEQNRLFTEIVSPNVLILYKYNIIKYNIHLFCYMNASFSFIFKFC